MSETVGFRVVAIIAAYNEQDIVGQVVNHLISEGVLVYFMDHGSTDGTVQAINPYLGKGLLRIEQFSDGSAEWGQFSWQRILERKQAIAQELDAHWFIHQDADEFRESPWPDRNLREAIRTVDRLGYSAIDFEVLNFRPTHNEINTGDVREAFHYYETPQPFDKLQVRCWKKTGARVDLASTGGHEVRFEGRRIFPLRFIMRHYPIRGQAHGERKVFVDRRPRLVDDEHARGWHIQYDQVAPGHEFVVDPRGLTRYDPDAVRLQLVLRSRLVEELEASMESLRAQIDQERDAHQREKDDLRTELVAARNQTEALTNELGGARHYIEALLNSRSWRLTAPLRILWGILKRLRSEIRAIGRQ